MGFTDAQKRTIEIVDNNSQIIACAGSGKTTTMVAKIMNLINQKDMEPQNIVAITYTEKAAASLKQKIYKEYENTFGNILGLSNMYVGTIHGYCLYLLQEFSNEFKKFEILNDVQTRLFMKKNRKVNGLFDVLYHPNAGQAYHFVNEFTSNENLQKAIKAYKTFLDIAREYGIENLNNSSLVSHVQKYEKSLYDNNYFDFTSIIMRTNELLETGKLNQYIKDTVKHMIVDEYQDVNDAQERIIRFFYEHGTKICVVGDDDQTIYHWRGSNLKYIKEFGLRYENVIKEDLNINFRSSKGITEVAKQVIKNNYNRIPKEMHSNNTQKYDNGDILAFEFDNRDNEVTFIISKIKQLLGNKYVSKGKEYKLDLDDMVILVSSVKKIPELIKALECNKIDFLVEGTQKLFEANEIKLLLDTFSLIFEVSELHKDQNKINIDSIIIKDNLINRWRNYTKLSEDKIEIALKEFVNFYVFADQYDYTIQENLKKLFIAMDIFENRLDEKVLYNWGEFTIIINDFEKINLMLQPYYRIRAFKTFLTEDAPLIYPEGWLSPNFKTIRCLRIMTYHQAKGLEYPVVFLPFLTQNAIFPLKNPGGINAWGIFNSSYIKSTYENDEESNRRLFYVGITRSEKYLFMTRSNVPYGTRGKMYNKAARVLIEAKNSLYVQHETFLNMEYEKSNKTKFSNDEIITLNFSLLKDLFDCPHKFKMLNIFGFTQPLDIRMGYGKSVHNMLDYIHKNYNEINLSSDKVINDIVEFYLYLPYGSPKLKTALKEKAFNHLKSYIINNVDKFKYIVFSEKAIDYALNEYMFINGRIDLVRDDLHKTTTIVDFKSDKEVLSKEQIRNQLMIYVLGYERLTGEKVDYIESYDFNKTDPTILPVTEDIRLEFRNKLQHCQDIIKENRYEKITKLDSNKKAEYCKSIKCTFFDSCFKK